MRRGLVLGIPLLLLTLAFSGCLEEVFGKKKGVDITHMITASQGAVIGLVLNKDDRPFNELRVRMYDDTKGDPILLGHTLTSEDGRFYFDRKFPGTYRLDLNLKDWPDCKVTVRANKYTNITIKQPQYSTDGPSQVCNITP